LRCIRSTGILHANHACLLLLICCYLPRPATLRVATPTAFTVVTRTPRILRDTRHVATLPDTHLPTALHHTCYHTVYLPRTVATGSLPGPCPTYVTTVVCAVAGLPRTPTFYRFCRYVTTHVPFTTVLPVVGPHHRTRLHTTPTRLLPFACHHVTRSWTTRLQFILGYATPPSWMFPQLLRWRTCLTPTPHTIHRCYTFTHLQFYHTHYLLHYPAYDYITCCAHCCYPSCSHAFTYTPHWATCLHTYTFLNWNLICWTTGCSACWFLPLHYHYGHLGRTPSAILHYRSHFTLTFGLIRYHHRFVTLFVVGSVVQYRLHITYHYYPHSHLFPIYTPRTCLPPHRYTFTFTYTTLPRHITPPHHTLPTLLVPIPRYITFTTLPHPGTTPFTGPHTTFIPHTFDGLPRIPTHGPFPFIPDRNLHLHSHYIVGTTFLPATHPIYTCHRSYSYGSYHWFIIIPCINYSVTQLQFYRPADTFTWFCLHTVDYDLPFTLHTLHLHLFYHTLYARFVVPYTLQAWDHILIHWTTILLHSVTHCDPLQTFSMDLTLDPTFTHFVPIYYSDPGPVTFPIPFC